MDGGAQGHRKKAKAKKPKSSKPKTGPKKPKTKKRSGDLSDKTVVELRKIARSCGAKQTNPNGSTKTKTQLKASIQRAK